MWAQLITTTLRPGHEDDLPKLIEEFRAAERPGSGFIRNLAMRDQSDPSKVYLLVVFESEEKARARESDPEREALLTDARALMAEMFDGPPQFVNLLVDGEFAP